MKQTNGIFGALLGLLVGTAQLAACSAQEVPLEEEPSADDTTSTSGGAGAPASPPTSSNSCTFRESPTSSYGHCSAPSGSLLLGDYPMNCPVYDEHSGSRGWGLPDEEDACGACRCSVQCAGEVVNDRQDPRDC